jgi:hypothetical protein
VSTSYVFYGDESGNSGTDYFDRNQPVYVFAAVGWQAEREAEVLQSYENICSLHGRTPPHLAIAGSKGASEWKAEKLLDRQSGRMFCESLLDMVLNSGMPCMFGIAEKRFLLTGMLVETYLDPTKNILAPAQDDDELRKKIASEIYKLTDDTLLEEFSAAVKSDDTKGVESVGNQIAGRLKLHIDSNIAIWSQAISRGALLAFRFGERHEDMPKRAERPHPGIQTLFPALLHLDAWLKGKDHVADLMIDEELPFNEVKRAAFELLSRPGNQFLNEICVSHLQNIRSMTFANSKSHFGIQLADVLAGIVMRGARNWLRGETDFVKEPVFAKAAKIIRALNPFPFIASQDTEAVIGWVKKP